MSLQPFGNGPGNMMPLSGTDRSKRMRFQASSTDLRKRPLQIMEREGRRSFEAFCFTRLLVVLPSAARPNSAFGRHDL